MKAYIVINEKSHQSKLFSGQDEAFDFVNYESEKLNKDPCELYEILSANVPREMICRMTAERIVELENQLNTIKRENDNLRKRNAFLECEPYRGPEFFKMLSEEIAAGVSIEKC